MCDVVHNYIGSHSEVVLRQFPVLVGGRKFHIHVRCAVSLGSMHSGWMTHCFLWTWKVICGSLG